MASHVFKVYLSYSQLCIFLSSLSQPFNDWSDRNFSQGFSWRPGSVSFRALVENGEHQVNLFIDEPVPPISESCLRAFQVPFENMDENIEIASISDSIPLKISAGKYSLQVEFLRVVEEMIPEVNLRFNKGKAGFSILRGDDQIVVEGDLDLMAQPAN